MLRIRNLSENRSSIDSCLHQLRDVKLQQDKHVFRENIKRIGRAIGHEISKELNYGSTQIETPMAAMNQPILIDQLVVITILRAGLPLHEGLLDVFPAAENGFIAAYRKHNEYDQFEIEVGYVACPALEGKVLILNDPMLATGSSFEVALRALSAYGKPSAVHLVSVIASKVGAKKLSEHEIDGDLWIGAIDPDLDENSYIVPGLGDAGDLSFGVKLQR